LVFVEVKTRTTNAYGAPELAVNPKKQEHMVKAALGYLKFKKLHQMPCRFDVVAISGEQVELIRMPSRWTGPIYKDSLAVISNASCRHSGLDPESRGFSV